MSDLFQRLRSDFHDEDYRHVYTNAFVDSKIATQIKVLREQRGWTQDELAAETGMRQARVSVLEDVNYSSWSLNTLRRFARAFDLYVDVEFRPFGTIRGQLGELNRERLERVSFADDPIFNPRLKEVMSARSEKITFKYESLKRGSGSKSLAYRPMENAQLRLSFERGFSIGAVEHPNQAATKPVFNVRVASAA